MKNVRSIVIVEDDLDDQELLAEVFRALDYTGDIKFFDDGYEALDFLESTDTAPSFILSDVNMPRINGYELREKVRRSVRPNVRVIPYLFLTTAAQKEAVESAYAGSVQGFFIKPATMRELQGMIRKILDYWGECYFSGDNHRAKRAQASEQNWLE